MDLLIYLAIGALILAALSIGGGYIIRTTGRKQAGQSFYVSLVVMLLTLAYGIFPLLGLIGTSKAIAYGLGAAASVLGSQFLFGEKAE